MKSFLILVLACCGSMGLFAQGKNDLPKLMEEPKLSVTKHRITVDGQVINYRATAGYFLIKSEKDEPQAKFFFISYTKDGVTDRSRRPLTFSFNGGPGSSSVWLHMGGLGPKRIKMNDDGSSTQPPYQVIDNPYTWLDETDLVFLDPMMTGFTRPAEEVDKEEFLGFEKDIQFVGDFIRLYTSRYERWSSPKFLVGESYGTTRAAGLAGYLQDRHGYYLNGIMLVSAVLNFQTLRDAKGNDLPFILHLPTIAATSWYHKKLGPEHSDLNVLLEEVEEFSLNDYATALRKGDQISAEERDQLIAKLQGYTGLSREYLDQTNLRLYVGRYNKELLRSQGKTVGRLDSRFTGYDYDEAGEEYEFDPSYNATIYGPFTAAVNDHIRSNLKYENDLPYEILTGRVRPWVFQTNGYLNVAETLRKAMTRNTYLKVWIANGYYDMATPYFATRYTVNHMYLKPEIRKNLSLTYYQAGHMMYIHLPSLVQFKKDFKNFIGSAY